MTRPVDTDVDHGQRRASYQQARSRQTKQSLIQAAVALWRTNGYAGTTVADICRAAGVSKGLFYFYFPRKEDLLLDLSILSSQAAARTAHARLSRPYQVDAVVRATLTDLERLMRRNPPELIIEAVLEGYRSEFRTRTVTARPSNESPENPPLVFLELFERAHADGKLPAHTEVRRLARLSQTLIGEGTRHWAAGVYGSESFADVVSRDIALLVAGFSQAPARARSAPATSDGPR